MANDMAYHSRSQARLAPVVFTLVLSVLATASCAGAPADSPTRSSLRVLEVSPAEYHGVPGDLLEEACREWTLSPSQVQEFFQLTAAYLDRPYSRYYQIDCSISGQLLSDGRQWRFAINGGGTATWEDGGTVRHFGCSARECGALLLLLTDGMEPE